MKQHSQIHVKVPCMFTENQVKKMITCKNKGRACKIQMKNHQIFSDKGVDMLVDEPTYKRMRKAKVSGKGCNIEMGCHSQSGGFLPLLMALAPLLPEIGTALATGLATGLSTAAGSAIVNKITGKGMTTTGQGMRPLTTAKPKRTRSKKKQALITYK